MTFIWSRKNPSDRTDCHLRKTACVEGRSRTILNICPGTADDILDVLQRRSVPDDFELVSFRFDTTAAIAGVDSELHFMEDVSEATGGVATAKPIFASR